MNSLEHEKEIRDKLKAVKIGVAGCGGLGSNATAALVRAGVKDFVLVDRDSIETSNLNRQFFFSKQVGEIKVDALKSNLLSIYADLNIDTFHTDLIPGEMHRHFTQCDIVLEALDDAAAKVAFIEDMQINCPKIKLIAVSGIAGTASVDKLEKIRSGSLTVLIDPEAEDSSQGILMAPRIIAIAAIQALEAVIEIISKHVNN